MKTWTLRQPFRNTGPDRFDRKIQVKRWWIIPTLIIAGLPGYFIYQKNHDNQILNASSTRPVAESTASEKQFPEEYVTGQIKMRRNFIDEIIVEGSLRNIATSTVYKNVVLQVAYISKSGTILFTKDYPVCETLKPNTPAKFKFKNPSSQEVDHVSAKILQANPQ